MAYLPEEHNQEEVVEDDEQHGDDGPLLLQHSVVAQLDEVGVVRPTHDSQDEDDR